MPKVTQKDANYQKAPDEENLCADCANFVSPDSCTVVSGTISPEGTCDLFAPKAEQGRGMDTLMTELFGGAPAEGEA